MLAIAYYVASSLDGFIAKADGSCDFLNRYLGGGSDYGYSNFYASVDVILMGSKTYEFALDHGPWQSPDKPSIVFTSRQLPQAHDSVQLTDEPPENIIDQLQDQGHRRAWFMGGGQLAAYLLHHRLIDELLLALTPDILGDGIPLFGRTGKSLEAREIELLSETAHDNGVVQLHYRFGR